MQFLNGNEEFPEGIEIKFFTKDGQLETTMRADRGYYIKKENLYRGEGNVQIKNLIKDQSLQSEEIFWNQAGKKIYTDKFVTIQDKQTLSTGLEWKPMIVFPITRLRKFGTVVRFYQEKEYEAF